MRADSHVHTRFSIDSEAKPEDYISFAAENNIDFFCFTEHVDFNKDDDGVGYYNGDDFYRE